MITDLRYAIRQLLKAPSLSGTAIFALALGIGATTAIFAVVYAFLLRPLPFAEPEQLVMLKSQSTRSGSDLGVNYLDFCDWQGQARSFSGMAYFNLRWNGNLEAPDGSTETLKTTFTTANLFELLGVTPTLGRDLTPADDEPGAPKVVLISHRLWQRTFGSDPAIAGRRIRLDGELRTVVGVMPRDFRFPSQTDLWVPMRAFFAQIGGRFWRADQAIGRRRAGVTIPQAQVEMTLIAQRLARQYSESNKDVGAAVVALREHWTGNVRSSLVLLLAACAGVLFMACANVSQLLLARAVTRRREFSVRAALGASRWQLVRQLLTESALLAFVGSAAGILLAFWLTDFIAAWIPVELPFWIQIDLNPGVLAFTIAISCLSAFLAGCLPAWQTARLHISEALQSPGAGTTGGTNSGGRTREILMMAQVAMSVVLLVGASLLFRSVTNLDEVNPGFDPRGVLMMEVNPTWDSAELKEVKANRYARILEHLAALPAVEAAAANNSPPFVAQRPWNRAEFIAEGQSASAQSLNPRTNFQTVSADYFRVLRIPLLRGRVFNVGDTFAAPQVCVISHALAERLWPNEDAIGRRLRFGSFNDPESEKGEWMTIVGVVGDLRHQALTASPGPDIYNPIGQLAWKQMHYLVRARPGVDAASLAPAVRRKIAALEPGVGVFNFVSLEKEVADSVWQSRLRGWLLGFFSLVALALAATGLSGTMAYGVTQRTREIGIRMALGATRARVLRLVVRHGMRAVLLGVLVGLFCAFAFSRYLQASLFGISGCDLWSYAAACLLLILTASVACFYPARRAARVNPMEALRHE